MYPDITALLSKSGLSISMVSVVRNDRHSDGGTNIVAMFHYQGISHTAAIVEHYFRNIATGIRIDMH